MAQRLTRREVLKRAGSLVAAAAIQRELAVRYDFAVVVPWAEKAPYIFYGSVLFIVMVTAVITGFGRKKG